MALPGKTSTRIVFVHGMFQTPRSWEHWIRYFTAQGYDCVAPAWPYHDGEPADLRANPAPALGKLTLGDVIRNIEMAVGTDKPILIGHSVGGLIAQILMNRGLLSAAVAVSSVAPNGIIDFDLNSLKNIAVIANPFKGDDPVLMDMKTFHTAFANTLTDDAAAEAYDRTAVHDSRNVLRDCMGKDGKIDMKRLPAPLLLIGGAKDEIIPAHLVEKNCEAYEDDAHVAFKTFPQRSHFICGEPGWEEVARYIAEWLTRRDVNGLADTTAAETPARATTHYL